MQQLAEGTAWESVKVKYEDILKLFRNKLSENEQEAVSLGKVYLHNREEITRDILSTKLKAVRIKYRQVRWRLFGYNLFTYNYVLYYRQ